MKSLIRKILQFWESKKKWKMPKQSNILIYDSCNSQLFLEYLSKYSVEMLHTRSEEFCIPLLILSLFDKGKHLENYRLRYIKKVKPKLIVTFIDNDFNFYHIHQSYPLAKTLFIQNGWRGFYADIFERLDQLSSRDRSLLHVDYMLTFGSMIGKHYEKYINGKSFAIGSLKNNQLPKMQKIEPGTIAFISQWCPEGFYMNHIFYSHEDFFEKPDRVVLDELVKYSFKHSKCLKIVLRNNEEGTLRNVEMAYFKKLLGNECHFYQFSGKFPTYQALDSAEVVVTIDSTLGYESISRGNKTAFFAIRSKMLNIEGLSYAWPLSLEDDGLFWTNTASEDSIHRVMDNLFNLSTQEWLEYLKNSQFESLMVFDKDNSQLQEILHKELAQ